MPGPEFDHESIANVIDATGNAIEGEVYVPPTQGKEPMPILFELPKPIRERGMLILRMPRVEGQTQIGKKTSRRPLQGIALASASQGSQFREMGSGPVQRVGIPEPLPIEPVDPKDLI